LILYGKRTANGSLLGLRDAFSGHREKAAVPELRDVRELVLRSADAD